MKDTLDKLDGFEQVLSILIKKISAMEDKSRDPNMAVYETTHQMLSQIQEGMSRMPSKTFITSELLDVRKRIDSSLISHAKQKPIKLDFRVKGYLISTAILLSTTVTALIVIKFLKEENEQLHQTKIQYETTKKVAPELTILIENSYALTSEPSVDSLQRIWRRRNLPESKIKLD
jgi:hypothetical protein